MLYVVATPIGNLADFSQRAVDVLSKVDKIAVENIAHAKILLSKYNIGTPVIKLHDHNERRLLSKVLNQLQTGSDIALISDAGTPLISDPGFLLVKAAHENNISVSAIPGPSALITALSVAGLPIEGFMFIGFLPAKSLQRQQRLRSLAVNQTTMVFYEAPHRIIACLQDLVAIFGEDRQILFARELTKQFETIRYSSLGELLAFVNADPNQVKGEIVLVVAGNKQQAQQLTPAAIEILELLKSELPLNKAASITAKITKVPKRVIYDYAKDNS